MLFLYGDCICVKRKRYSALGSVQSDAFVARCLFYITFLLSFALQLVSVAGPGSMTRGTSESPGGGGGGGRGQGFHYKAHTEVL